MYRLRTTLIARLVSAVLVAALLALFVGPVNRTASAQHLTDRLLEQFGTHDTIYLAAQVASDTSPASFNEFLAEFVDALESETGSASRVLLGHNISAEQLLDLLKSQFANELAPAVATRHVLSEAPLTGSVSRARSALASSTPGLAWPDKPLSGMSQSYRTSEGSVSWGFIRSSIQPLGP